MLEVQNDSVYIGGVEAAELVARFGEPLYIYDADAIEARVRQLRSMLPSTFEIMYSVKANPNISIVNFLYQLVNGVEVASLGELHVALMAGIDSKNIIFVGPSKSDGELVRAIENCLACIVVESEEELERVSRFARELKYVPRVALRINPAFHGLGAKLRMSGVSRQFGIDEERAENAIRMALDFQDLTFVGLHFYLGTGILDYKAACYNMASVLELALNLARKTGAHLEMVDIGGGLGVPYFCGESEFDVAAFAKEVRVISERFCAVMPQTRLITELGRFLVAESGMYIARVRYVKMSRAEKYVMVSGGMNHFMTPPSQSRLVRSLLHIEVLNRRSVRAKEEVNICGPLCTPHDVWGRFKDIPALARGDLIGLCNTGAYGLTASPADFLSHPRPAEVLTQSGKAYLIRNRSKVEDILRDQVFPGNVIESFKSAEKTNCEL